MTSHPLDRLTADEIARNRTLLDKAGLVGATTRFPLVMLVEPPKRDVLAWRPGDVLDRWMALNNADPGMVINQAGVPAQFTSRMGH